MFLFRGKMWPVFHVGIVRNTSPSHTHTLPHMPPEIPKPPPVHVCIHIYSIPAYPPIPTPPLPLYLAIFYPVMDPLHCYGLLIA